MSRHTPLWLGALLTLACRGEGGEAPPPPDVDAAPAVVWPDRGVDAAPIDAALPDAALPDAAPIDAGALPSVVEVYVTLDGVAAPDTRVVQGGARVEAFTDAEGRARLQLDLGVIGDLMVIASHPRARQRGVIITPGVPQPIALALRGFGLDDPSYQFQDPGEPGRRDTTAQCGHCHLTLNDAWSASAHRGAASNPVVHDLYAGTAAALDDPTRCEAAGGRWRQARIPGGVEEAGRCFLGEGVLPALNPGCAEGPCAKPDLTGGCADCHAPAIDGALGGRDLLEARGIAFDYGVSCDVCHRVEAVLDVGPPGVAGRLKLHRPGRGGPIILESGEIEPLTFGPSHDAPNPRMGTVQRDHFRDGRICSGCHQHEAAPLTGAADPARWPDGVLPLQSTWAEWEAGPQAGIPCQSCHMPPEPGVANGADLQAFPAALVGYQAGWYRPAGSVRAHSWLGPKVGGPLGGLAAALDLEVTREGARLTARVVSRNVGAGHALPTGEAMRQLLLKVEATCEGAPLTAVDGDVIPAWGGAVASRPASESWAQWPEARVGDVIRVTRLTGAFYDYEALSPFDGFDVEGKGRPVERAVGAVRVMAVEGGAVTLDRPLPEGDWAHLTRDRAWAGAAGFGFARVVVDAAGRQMPPSFMAVDVRSDLRLPPGGAWASTHVFEAAGCAAPEVHARLVYRAWPWALGEARGWAPRERVMAEARR